MARNTAKHPTMSSTTPSPSVHPKMSVALRSRNPEVGKLPLRDTCKGAIAAGCWTQLPGAASLIQSQGSFFTSGTGRLGPAKAKETEGE